MRQDDIEDSRGRGGPSLAAQRTARSPASNQSTPCRPCTDAQAGRGLSREHWAARAVAGGLPGLIWGSDGLTPHAHGHLPVLDAGGQQPLVEPEHTE